MIVPVLAVAFVGVLIVRGAEVGKTEAGLDQAKTAAEGLYRESRKRAQTVAQTVADDEELAAAVRDGDRAALQRRLEDLARRGGAVRVRLTLNGEQPVEAGGGDAVAPAVTRIVDSDGVPAGRMRLSVTTAQDFADVLARVTGLEVLLTQGDDVLAGTVETEHGARAAARGLGRAERRAVPRRRRWRWRASTTRRSACACSSPRTSSTTRSPTTRCSSASSSSRS